MGRVLVEGEAVRVAMAVLKERGVRPSAWEPGADSVDVAWYSWATDQYGMEEANEEGRQGMRYTVNQFLARGFLEPDLDLGQVRVCKSLGEAERVTDRLNKGMGIDPDDMRVQRGDKFYMIREGR
jgi:hypothetical protein